ncbi:TPA: hypothetical protein ACH3X2_004622 [Trebouxia sp. C0005]
MLASSKTVKVVLLGEGRVGKTSLALRFVHNTFNHSQQASLQASFLTKQIIAGSQQVELAIWDTAGQERFHALGPIYYRDAQAALLVYDITDADSFTRVQTWVQELRQMIGPGIVIAIAANKQDLQKMQTISAQESEAYAASIHALHVGTSAKTGLGLQDVFQAIADQVIDKSPAPGAAQHRPAGRLVVIDDNGVAPQSSTKSSACC